MMPRGRSLPRGRCDARRARDLVYAPARPDKIYGPNSDCCESEEACLSAVFPSPGYLEQECFPDRRCGHCRQRFIRGRETFGTPRERHQRSSPSPCHLRAQPTQHRSSFLFVSSARQPYPSGADETIFLVPEVTRKRTSAHIALIKQRGSIMYRAETGGFHEASNIIRNRSRYPSHCCNHHAVVTVTFDRASCRRYSHRSLQEFPQPDRSKSFRTIALLTWGFRFTEARVGLPSPILAA